MKNITLKKLLPLILCFFLFFNVYSENNFFSNLGINIPSPTVTLTSSNQLIIDSNQSCVGQGPRATYISYKFCNTTGSSLTDVSANFAISVSGAPGFALAGNQPATQLIGNLDDGECVTLFWYIEYPCFPENQTAEVTVNLIDNGARIAFSKDTLTTKTALSTGATGELGTISINNSSVGQLTTMDVEYKFGTTTTGGDISFQPVGNANFNAECFQLIGFEVLQSDFSCIVVGSEDDMYFQLPSNCSVNGSGNTVNVRYYFKNKCVGTSTDIRPYAYGLSGQNLKYSPNYNDGSSLKTLPPSAPPTLTVTKVASENHFETVPATVKYTVTVTNTSALPSTIDNLSDELPSPFSFDAIDGTSGITTVNSSKYPSSSDTGTLLFEGGKDSGVYPYTEYYIAGNSSIDLVYTVTIPSNTANGTYQNSVTYSVGNFTSQQVTSSVTVGPALVITANNDDFTGSPIESALGGTTSSVFNDNGSGVDDANGIAANDSNIDDNISITNNGGIIGATINTDGTINIPANTSAGTYTLTYQICLGLDNMVCDTAEVTIKVVDPKIGLAKETTSVTSNNNGSYTVTYLLTVENFGDVALSNISLTDDIINQFSGMNPSGFTATSGTLSANATWDGTSESNILASGQSLAIGVSGTVSISFIATPTTSGTINNTATVTGLSTLNTTITDISTEGTDPDGTDNDNNPDEDTPTATIFPENPVIGLAKDLVSSTNNNDGTFTVTYLLTVKNFGNVALSNLFVTDDIISQFSGMNPTEFTATSGTLTADSSGWWNGSSNRNILLGNQSLAIGETGTVTISFTVTPGVITNVDNTANVTATSPVSTVVSDISTNGTNPDGTDNDNLPDESIPTPTPFIQNFVPSTTDDAITVDANTLNNSIDVLQNDNFGNDGPNSGTITLPSNTSTNLGALLVDDNSTPNDPTDDKILYTPAANFNGVDTFTYTITDGNGDTSTATVTVTVAIVENPSIGLAKNVESVVNNNNGTYTITYLFTIENFGNVELFNLFLSDDIVSQFTGLNATNYSVTSGTLNGDTTGWWNGSANRNILLDGQSIAAGATGTVFVTFTVTPGLVSNVDNTATITGYTSQNVMITDVSTDGLDPDGIDDDNNPDEDTPTATTLVTSPLLAVDDTATVDQNSNANLIDVLDNDSYGSIGASLTHPLTFLNGSLSNASANGGAVVIGDNGTPNNLLDDVVLYTPLTDFVGIDTFQYTITDANGNAATATVTVTVAVAALPLASVMVY